MQDLRTETQNTGDRQDTVANGGNYFDRAASEKGQTAWETGRSVPYACMQHKASKTVVRLPSPPATALKQPRCPAQPRAQD